MDIIDMKSPCGFCKTNNCEQCCIGIQMKRHNIFKGGITWVCPCECNIGRIKCVDCGNTKTEEVSADTWTCVDSDACAIVIETRRENDPFTRKLREYKERATMAKIEDNKNKAEKAAKEPTTGTCVCCGGETKGGLFLPGHDARHISALVKTVAAAGFTKKAADEARVGLKKAGASEVLVAKFDKSLGINQENAAKKEAAAKAKADAKAAADKEKAEKAAAAKAEKAAAKAAEAEPANA